MKTTDRASLAHMVIGPERAERLITRYADGLALRWGMRLEAARKYAEAVYAEAAPVMVLAPGQVWSRPDGKELPGDAIAGLLGQDPNEQWTVAGFSDDGMMVEVGRGVLINPDIFNHLWLTAWPEQFTLNVEAPQPPAKPIALESPGAAAGDGERDEEFDPRCVWFTAGRSDERGFRVGNGLPMLGDHYRAVNWYKPEYDPYYGNGLDVVAYLAEHLADYRAGWADFVAQWRSRDWIDHFNELDGGCECPVEVSAYLGRWLWQRVRADVVAEYGGTVDDYDVWTMWSPSKADAVIAAAPYADPEWEIPSDHPLGQCDGQLDLLGGGASSQCSSRCRSGR